jgi:hypothetical protein
MPENTEKEKTRARWRDMLKNRDKKKKNVETEKRNDRERKRE